MALPAAWPNVEMASGLAAWQSARRALAETSSRGSSSFWI
jgi:hypothetical protein